MDRADENHTAQQGSDFTQSHLTPPDPTGSAVSVQSVWSWLRRILTSVPEESE